LLPWIDATDCVGRVFYVGSHPPRVKAQYPATLVVQRGSNVRISCPVHGVPRPLVSWTKDSHSVHLGWQRFRVQRAGSWLYVTDVQSTDSGRYTCEATNGFGTASVTINLHVVREYKAFMKFSLTCRAYRRRRRGFRGTCPLFPPKKNLKKNIFRAIIM